MARVLAALSGGVDSAVAAAASTSSSLVGVTALSDSSIISASGARS